MFSVDKKLLKSGAKYSTASTCSAICSMIIGFVNMRWLGPDLLGIWQSVTIISSYLPILQLGVQSGLNQELPILLGANKKEDAMKMVSTALYYAIFLALFFMILTIITIVYLCMSDTDIKTILGVFVVCNMAIFNCFKSHYIATYRSSKAFDYLSSIYWVDCLVTLTLTYVIYKYNYFGLLLFHFIKDGTLALMMYKFAPYRTLKPCFHRKDFIILLKRGIFMSFFNEIKGIYHSLPRLLLLYTGGVVFVGIFNPALVVGTFMNLFPTQIAQFLHPQMGMKYGKTGMARDMWPYFKKLTFFVPLFLVIPAVFGWLFIPYVIEYVFPKYVESIWPIRIMLLGFMFSTTFFSRGFLITIKAYSTVIGLSMFDIFLFLVLSIVFINLSGFNILIALSFALSSTYFLTYILNILVVKHTIFQAKYNKGL